MLPVNICKMVEPDSSMDELRQISNSTGADLNELWDLRVRKAKAFERGVGYARRKYRNI